MNDSQHLACYSSNITSTSYTPRLERINYDMAIRILDVKRNRSQEGAVFRFSLQDYLFTHERNVLLNIAKMSNKRRVGRIIF